MIAIAPIRQDWNRSCVVGGDALVPLSVLDRPLLELHALLVAVLIHIADVVTTELHEGGGIISAMFSGRKAFDRQPRDRSEEPT